MSVGSEKHKLPVSFVNQRNSRAGERRREKKHAYYLHQHNEQWVLDIKDSTCHPLPPNSISQTDQLYLWQPRPHLKPLMTFQQRTHQNGCDYFVLFCVCVPVSVSNLFAHISFWSKCLIIALFELRLQPLCQHGRWGWATDGSGISSYWYCCTLWL